MALFSRTPTTPEGPRVTPGEFCYASVQTGPDVVEPVHPPASADHMPRAEVLALFGGSEAGLELATTHGLQSTNFYVKTGVRGGRTIWYSRAKVNRWLEERAELARLMRR